MEEIQIKDFMKFHFLGNMKSSPNQKKSAFIGSLANWGENDYHHTLYTFDQNGIEKVRFLKNNANYIFINDDTLLLDYQKNKAERKNLKEKQKKQFYYFHLRHRRLEKAFELPINGQVEEVIDQNNFLVSAQLSVEDHILYPANEAVRKDYLKKQNKQTSYEDINELPYYFNGKDFTANKHKQLFIWNLKDKSLKPLVDKAFSIEKFVLSKDRQSIYYSGKYTENVMTHTSAIYQYNIQVGSSMTLYPKKDYNIIALIDMGQLVVVARDMKNFGINQNPDFYELNNGKLTKIRIFGHTFGNSIGTDCRLLGNKQYVVKDKVLFFLTTVDDHSELLKFTIDGQLDLLYKFNGSADGLTINNGVLYIIGMMDQGLQTLYYLDDNQIKKVSSFNDDVLKGSYVAKPKEVIVKKETHTVKGFVLLPEAYNPNLTYPMILDIHGGPKTVYGQIYYHEMQYWVNQGYIIAYANPRGSDGKGDVFADIRGKYGSIDYDDLMAFTDQVIKVYPSINKDQMYVTGGSYGGFMTNWIVGHTNRFKAAVTQRSISNWISFYGTSDIGYYFATDQTDGHPILDMNKLYDQSPIKHAMKVETPLLFIHSDKDLRCPIEQAQQFYAILKTRGIDTELKWFKEETHELSRAGKPQARVKRLKDITNWFKTH
ncbi:MAG TPA: S9 family peptidase [Candidatus Izemoplasmatales bacterium]|nr:S9 family peptidase [Candidatus Izemoplasmatales bacterium]